MIPKRYVGLIAGVAIAGGLAACGTTSNAPVAPTAPGMTAPGAVPYQTQQPVLHNGDTFYAAGVAHQISWQNMPARTDYPNSIYPAVPYLEIKDHVINQSTSAVSTPALTVTYDGKTPDITSYSITVKPTEGADVLPGTTGDLYQREPVLPNGAKLQIRLDVPVGVQTTAYWVN